MTDFIVPQEEPYEADHGLYVDDDEPLDVARDKDHVDPSHQNQGEGDDDDAGAGAGENGRTSGRHRKD
jgi:hypothetical protein